MKFPFVRSTVRRMMVTATICAATSGGFTHVVRSQSIGVVVSPLGDPSRMIPERITPVLDSVELALFTPVVTMVVETDDQKKARPGGPDEARRAQIKEYYPTWVGVRAPELGQAGRDHDGKPVTLTSFRGKRVLLFSFDAGDFNRAPGEKAVLANLRALDKAIRTVGREDLAVVGFTEGMQFVWPGVPKPDGELGRLSDFPIVSGVPTTIRKFNEPYNLLLEPGAILIDRKGILRAFYDHPMSERELLDAVTLTDWDKPVRPNPVEDPWSGKGPRKPTHTATIAWSRNIPRVVGMTGGDWDLRGSDDLIVAATGELHVLDPVDGKERHKFPVKEILGPLDGKERHKFPIKDIGTGLVYTLGWARVGKEKSAVFATHGGWPHQVPVIGRDGAPLWKLEYFPAGVDSVAWVDLDGVGEKTLIIGFNGGGGLATFGDGGRKHWNLLPRGNIWTVAGIDAIGGRPGLVIFSNGEKVSVVDSNGRDAGTISTDGHYVVKVAASEMDGAGERQVVSVWPANVGTADYVVATDLKGNVLWKYPVNVNEMGQLGPEILAVDVTGDGTKEWIICPNGRELVVLDARGQLVARIAATKTSFPVWTAIERKGKPGRIVAVEADKVSAFALAPQN